MEIFTNFSHVVGRFLYQTLGYDPFVKLKGLELHETYGKRIIPVFHRSFKLYEREEIGFSWLDITLRIINEFENCS